MVSCGRRTNTNFALSLHSSRYLRYAAYSARRTGQYLRNPDYSARGRRRTLAAYRYEQRDFCSQLSHPLVSAFGQDQDRPPTAWEFLNAYSFARGFMNARGLPDVMRGGRIVLKDFVKGKLLYCQPPPGYPQLESKVRCRRGRGGHGEQSHGNGLRLRLPCFSRLPLLLQVMTDKVLTAAPEVTAAAVGGMSDMDSAAVRGPRVSSFFKFFLASPPAFRLPLFRCLSFRFLSNLRSTTQPMPTRSTSNFSDRRR
jgi:hypothetical protein